MKAAGEKRPASEAVVAEQDGEDSNKAEQGNEATMTAEATMLDKTSEP